MQTMNIPYSEKAKIFLKEYYVGQGMFLSLSRVMTGPIILVAGLSFYFGNQQMPIANYSGLMISFGIYYIVRPLIFMLTKKAWFKNFDLSFQVNEADVRLKLDNSESVIAYSDFQTIQKKDGYFVMKLDARQTLYLPFQSLADSDFQFIDSQIK